MPTVDEIRRDLTGPGGMFEVTTELGATLTEADVRSWVAAALAAFKVPAHVEVRTERLPRNASGKLLKNVLRGEGEMSFAETM